MCVYIYVWWVAKCLINKQRMTKVKRITTLTIYGRDFFDSFSLITSSVYLYTVYIQYRTLHWYNTFFQGKTIVDLQNGKANTQSHSHTIMKNIFAETALKLFTLSLTFFCFCSTSFDYH